MFTKTPGGGFDVFKNLKSLISYSGCLKREGLNSSTVRNFSCWKSLSDRVRPDFAHITHSEVLWPFVTGMLLKLFLYLGNPHFL
jgi:hypothetical protein